MNFSFLITQINATSEIIFAVYNLKKPKLQQKKKPRNFFNNFFMTKKRILS